MLGINFVAVLVAAVAVQILSTIWYIVFAKKRAILMGEDPKANSMMRPSPVKMLLELVRNLVLVTVVAYLVGTASINEWSGALIFGLGLWIGFPLILLTGSIMWDKVPAKLAAIHAGDWLIKLVVVTSLLTLWH